MSILREQRQVDDILSIILIGALSIILITLTARKESARETAPAQFCQPQQRCLTALCGHVPVPIAPTPLEPVPQFPARLMPRPRLRIRYDR
jgi:hypothetical protein